MRYLIEQVKLDKDHPQWPNELVFKIFDRHTGNWSFSCYTTLEAAERALAKKEERLEKLP